MTQNSRYAGAITLAVARCLVLNLAGHIIIAPSDALRMINLDVPQMAVQGDTIQLSCSYSLMPDEAADRRHNSAVSLFGLGDEQADGSSSSSSAGEKRSPHIALLRADERRLVAAQPSSRADDRLSSARGNAGTPAYKLVEQHADASRQPELLYAIKWYKDEREFFRFVTQDWPHKQALLMDSLNIDVDKSDNQTVVLRNVTLRTSGSFRCEVSTDAPSFLTKSIERKVLVYSLPTEGPMIESQAGLSRSQLLNSRQPQYLNDQLDLTCVSPESKPHVQLDWILNEHFNLSSAIPLNSNNQPAFQVHSKRLVRLPAHQPTLAQDNPLDLLRSNPNLETRAPSYTSYALEQANTSDNQFIAKSMVAASSTMMPQTISLSVETLSRLPEVTLSRLNFSIDTDIIRLISEQLSGGGSGDRTRTKPQAVSSAWRKGARAHVRATSAGTTNLTPQGNSSLAAPEEVISASHRQPAFPSAWHVLRVRCVARVMHLRMSDDIKLVIVNKTRESAAAARSQNLPTKPTSRRGGTDGNSANGSLPKNLNQRWLLSLSLMWIIARAFLSECWHKEISIVKLT